MDAKHDHFYENRGKPIFYGRKARTIFFVENIREEQYFIAQIVYIRVTPGTSPPEWRQRKIVMVFNLF